jgi:hypothetical protein
MASHDYRHRAREHFKSAKARLLEKGIQAARYACLELRMTIEALTYETLETYLAEVPNSAMKQWTPKKVIDELLALDPHADRSSVIFVGVEETPGVQSSNMQLLGEDRRFTVKWANKAHNALGNFLHETTISELDKGKDDSETTIRTKVAEIVSELEGTLSRPMFKSNFGSYISYQCGCGFIIKRKQEALTSGTSVACAGCGRRYTYHLSQNPTQYIFEPDRYEYERASCKKKSHIEAHEVEKLPTLTCECGAKAQISRAYAIDPIVDASH